VTRPTILVTGAAGQLGFELARLLPEQGFVIAADRSQLDLSDADSISNTVRALKPDLIVNAAAYTAVDKAEAEPALAHAINARAPAILAEEARRLGAVLIHYSTDYVFDGAAALPYAEEAPTHPLNEYGKSKEAGEQAILQTSGANLVLRTSWVYGLRGRNFLLTVRRLAAERNELRIVADQIGTPNWSRSLAEATAILVGLGLPVLAERAGLYHLSAAGSASWFDFAVAIVGPGAATKVLPITSDEYPLPARRPAYAVLATTKFQRTFGFTLPEWRTTLKACLAAD
jgi:dTDP-4-dehydrorhamnose reductase